MRSDLLSFLKYLLVQNVEKIFSKFFYLAKEGKVNMFVGNVLKKYITAIAGVYAISIGALFASEPIVIGLPLAQTGPVGVADHQDHLNGTILAIEEINAGGGVLGRPLEYKIVDTDLLTPEGTQAAFQKLVDEKVHAFFQFCFISLSSNAES